MLANLDEKMAGGPSRRLTLTWPLMRTLRNHDDNSTQFQPDWPRWRPFADMPRKPACSVSRAPGRWTGDLLRTAGDETYAIIQCDSPLTMRAALQEASPDVTALVL